MANEDNGMRFGDKSKIKKTVYRNGKLVKDEMEKSPKPKANPRAAAKPVNKPAAKPAAKKAAPMEKSKVPMTREKKAERKKIGRDTREIIDRGAASRSVKGKSRTVSDAEWKRMSRAERQKAGVPVSPVGKVLWGTKTGTMKK